jgi:hypothetical protein
MNKGKTDKRILAIKAQLDGAAYWGSKAGFSSTDVLDAGALVKVQQAEAAAGFPKRSAQAAALIASVTPKEALLVRLAVIARDAVSDPLRNAWGSIPAGLMLLAVKNGVDAWIALVGTNAIFDFKNGLLSKANLDTQGCPGSCPGETPTITIGNACYEHDLPGNIFFAYVCRFVGFSRDATHLGSQYAELSPKPPKPSGKPDLPDWDSPEDEAALDLGYDLPQKTLTRAVLVGALGANTGIAVRPCAACTKVYNPPIPWET